MYALALGLTTPAQHPVPEGVCVFGWTFIMLFQAQDSIMLAFTRHRVGLPVARSALTPRHLQEAGSLCSHGRKDVGNCFIV